MVKTKTVILSLLYGLVLGLLASYIICYSFFIEPVKNFEIKSEIIKKHLLKEEFAQI